MPLFGNADVQVALVTALVVVVVFVIASVAQGRRQIPAPAPSTVAAPAPALEAGATKAGLSLIDDRMAGFESRITPRLSAIEEHQKMVEERQKSTEHDVRNIRTAMNALPSKDAVHRLEVQLAELHGRVVTADALALATNRSVDRILNHLLQESAK